MHGHSQWDRAIDLTNLLVDLPRARVVAATLGSLAGTLKVDRPRGLEIVLDVHPDPDVMVWLARAA